MDLQEIISELKTIKIKDSEDYSKLEIIETMCDQIMGFPNGELACQALIELLERHGNIDFGNPGTPVHTLERFVGYYETHLFESLRRNPIELTVWMLNRIINGKHGKEKLELMELLEQCANHQLASSETKESAYNFLQFQIKH
tara:strand:- start:569 stop:997 length:429 start_codon:yes stop_codon:yes gene_type:complete